MTSSTEATYHETGPDRILGGFMVAPVAVNTGNPALSHSALPPGQDEARTALFMAVDTDAIILFGDYTLKCQREKDEDKPYRIKPATVAPAFHKALPSLIFLKLTKKRLALIIPETIP